MVTGAFYLEREAQRYGMPIMKAAPTGFEPAISALTGPHVKPLHHGTVSAREFITAAIERQYTLKQGPG
jgi:hypothetical protein